MISRILSCTIIYAFIGETPKGAWMIKKAIFRIIVIVCVCFLFAACEKEDVSVELSGEAEHKEQKITGSKNENKGQDCIVVYVNGAVKHPGVYTMHPGDRIYQAVDMAGGMTSDARKDALNLAETIADAQNIHIMTKSEYRKGHKNNIRKQSGDTDTKLVNINTADKEQLTILPGIGEAKAEAVIAYREEKGFFSSKEDIKKVSGIGEATYTNIKDLITIE